MKPRYLAIAVAWAVLPVGAGFPTDQASAQMANPRSTLSIEGTVSSAWGSAIVGATVVLVRQSSGAYGVPTVSDKGGRYAFVDLAPDTYTLEVTMSGFHALRHPDIAVVDDGRRVFVHTALQTDRVPQLMVVSQKGPSAPTAVLTGDTGVGLHARDGTGVREFRNAHIRVGRSILRADEVEYRGTADGTGMDSVILRGRVQLLTPRVGQMEWTPRVGPSETGTVAGAVVAYDGGMALPGVTVVLISESNGSRGVRRLTNEAGAYSFADVTPGVYTAEVTMPGFVTLRQVGVRVEGGILTTIPALALEIGEFVESVPVHQ